MKFKTFSIILIMAFAAFVLTGLAWSDDDDDGGGYWSLFRYFQRQINKLQQQINELQQGCIPAAYSTNGFRVVTEDYDIVMEIFLPAGDFVSNIRIGSQYQAEGHGWWPECWALLECQIINRDTNDPFPDSGFMGNVVGITTHSSTGVLELNEDTTVALTCRNGCYWCPEYPDTPLNVGGSWTFIEVEHR
jgi:hypothetical protein